LTFDAVPDPIAIIDNQYRILRVNRAMVERLGRRAEECSVSPAMSASMTCPNRQTSAPYRLLKEGVEQRAEVHEERLGGTPRDDLAAQRPARQAAGLCARRRDITERKRMEEDLLALNRDLLKTNANLKTAYRWMRENATGSKKSSLTEAIAFLVDQNGCIEGITEAAQAWSGRSRFKLTAAASSTDRRQGPAGRARSAGPRRFGMIIPFRVRTETPADGPGVFEVN
jgi:PAS domain S-box-containing protein